jgi:hypothetical protein
VSSYVPIFDPVNKETVYREPEPADISGIEQYVTNISNTEINNYINNPSPSGLVSQQTLTDTSGHLQGQIDTNSTAIGNLDDTYVTHTELEASGYATVTYVDDQISGIAGPSGGITEADLIATSGVLQDGIDANTTAISNLDDTYATDVELAAASGYLQSQISQNINDISGHINAADPHIQYLNSARGDSIYYRKSVIDNNIANVSGYFEEPRTDRQEPNGFINTTESVVTFDDAQRKLTVSPAVSQFSYYVGGTKYTKSSAQEVVISDTEGLHYIYFDENGIQETDSFDTDLITRDAFVTAIYWDKDNQKQIYFGDERHGINMPSAVHGYLHSTKGTVLQSGGGVSNLTIDGDGSSDSHAQLANDTTVIYDEDIRFSHIARLETDDLPIYYRDGVDASGIWRIDPSGSFPVVSAPAGRAYWNELNGGSWSLTEAPASGYIYAHIATLNDTTRPFATFMGQSVYTDLDTASKEIRDQVSSLIINGLPTQEFKFLATLLVQTDDSYTNTVKSRIVSLTDGNDYLDLRSTPFTRGGTSGTVVDHDELSNRTNDEAHPQYSLTDGSRAFTGTVSGISPTIDDHLTTKGYVDTEVAKLSFCLHGGLNNNQSADIDFNIITGVALSNPPWVIPVDCELRAVSAGARDTDTWTLRILKNDVQAYDLTNISQTAYANGLSVSFSAGDRVRLRFIYDTAAVRDIQAVAFFKEV